MDDDVANGQEVQQSIKRRKIKKEFVKQGIRVVALQSMPSKPTVSESILEFKQRHFFGQRVKRVSGILIISRLEFIYCSHAKCGQVGAPSYPAKICSQTQSINRYKYHVF